jgi:hypothetical protein
MATITDRFFKLLPESYDRSYEGVSLGIEEFITLDVAPASRREVETLSGYTLGDAHPVNTQSILDSFTFAALSPTQYVFKLSYIPKQLSDSESTLGVPQVNVQFNTWYTEKVAEFDTVTQLPIQNTVGDAPSPLPVVSVPNDEIIFTRRQSSVDLTRNSKKGRINSVAFNLVGVSIPQYCGMLSDYRFQPVYDDLGNVTYDVTYAFKTNYKKNVSGNQIGFKIELLNAGFSFYATASTASSKRFYENDDGSYPVDPVKINQDGTVPVVTPSYNEFVIHDTEDFSTWGLPTAWPY